MNSSGIKKMMLTAQVVILLCACNKTEGPGGTSTISGVVSGKEFEPAKNEITEVIVCQGNELEHGDYWIINNISGGTLYYVWYDNPGWISDGDPHLEGRTGIQVIFNYSDSNTDIANATATAIGGIAGADISVSVQNDILTLTNISAGMVADANNMTTAFEVNIAQQGDDQFWGTETVLADERVYIVYGDNDTYGDEARTGGNGDFKFTNLLKGTYSVYVLSEDTLNTSASVISSVKVEITENKSVVSGVNFNIVY